MNLGISKAIFSDVVMPGGMTGYDLALHAKERLPCVKVLLTSGYVGEAALAHDTTGSALRLLRKLYEQDNLVRTCRKSSTIDRTCLS